jgi:hypothetical protein
LRRAQLPRGAIVKSHAASVDLGRREVTTDARCEWGTKNSSDCGCGQTEDAHVHMIWRWHALLGLIARSIGSLAMNGEAF